MKKILLIMPYGSVGGMERLALTFYNHYRSLGYEVKALKIIKLDSDIIHFGDDELFLSGVDFSGMAMQRRMRFYFSVPLYIRRIIKKYGITHSIAFGDMANVFSSWTRTKELKVASMHAVKSIEFENKNFLNKVFKRAFRKSYRNFDKVVCISNAIKKDLLAHCGYAFDNLEVIYNPHDVLDIRRKSTESLLAADLALFEKEVVLFLGRMSVQKAPWHLINAFGQLQKQRPNAQLVLIGDGSAEVTRHLEQQIKQHQIENVHFLGRRSNPYQYMARAKVVALSSYYEGTPNVVVEAMALGIPVVSAFTPGITELMRVADVEETKALTRTEAGIVTPPFFKGKLEIPNTDVITEEEKIYAEALQEVLGTDAYTKTLAEHQVALLAKFDLQKVASAYLEPITRNK